MTPNKRRTRTLRFHISIALGILVLGTVGLWALLGRQSHWAFWLGSWLLTTNVVTFGYYGYDKSCARGSRARIPELVLHGLSAIGGSLGAYAGMVVFRHKTVKGTFRIYFWSIVTLQIALIIYVVSRIWSRG
ncbi:MAG: DUF1294 domain-containing protein [Gemmataceae bacterium]